MTQIAKQMVINYGFSDIGPWSLMDPNAQQGDMIMRMMARNSMSESLQARAPCYSSFAQFAHRPRACGVHVCAAPALLHQQCCSFQLVK